jgi:Globin
VLAPQADDVAAAFYGELFALDPALRAMFPADLAGQRRKLMAALATAVRALDRPRTIAPALEALGRRHAGYGVLDDRQDTVGAALLARRRSGSASVRSLTARPRMPGPPATAWWWPRCETPGGEDTGDVAAQLGLRLGPVLDNGDRAQPSVEAADAGTDHPARPRREGEPGHVIPQAKEAAAFLRTRFPF